MRRTITTSSNTEKDTYQARARIGKGVRPIVFGGAAILDFISLQGSSASLRNRLPEPFDVMNHAGNFSFSLWIGLGVSRLAGALVTKLDVSPKTMKTLCVGVGTVAVSAVNLLGETRWGVELTGSTSTPDLIDASYGIGVGTLSASMVDIEPAPVAPHGTSAEHIPKPS